MSARYNFTLERRLDAIDPFPAGTDVAGTSREFNEDARLPQVLDAIADFLRAAGFTYVEGVEAVCNNGTVHSSADV